jgi:DNA-binding TFAR19-related protein (PDSD5 family)
MWLDAQEDTYKQNREEKIFTEEATTTTTTYTYKYLLEPLLLQHALQRLERISTQEPAAAAVLLLLLRLADSRMRATHHLPHSSFP